MKIVDTRGEKCPKPIIETKKALKEAAKGETFIVLTDNKTSFNNITRFLSDNMIKFYVSESNGVWTFEVNNDSGIFTATSPESYCERNNRVLPKGDFAVSVSSEFMGSGDDILGKKLMKSFFITLSCLENVPFLIAFYNSGVKLAIRGSEVAELIVEFEKKGAEIILCGTCVDHFGLGDQIVAGKIGDMYLIMEKLSSAGNVIRP